MSNEATTMAEAMERKHSEPATPAPSALEIEAYALTLKNGIELGLGKQDPGIAIAAKLQAQYPHHLVLLQDGAFLVCYGVNPLSNKLRHHCIRKREFVC